MRRWRTRSPSSRSRGRSALAHIGFKDVGADASMLQSLTAAIREAGASPWMELVATTREAELRGVELGRDLGVDRLLGGVHVDEALQAPRGLGDPLSAVRRRAHRPSDAAWRRRAGTSRRNAGPSLQKAARASTFSLIAQLRPSRSTSSPPAGADSSTSGVVVVAGSCQFAGTRCGCSRRGRGRVHHRHGGDRGFLRARRRTAGGAARGGPRRLRRRPGTFYGYDRLASDARPSGQLPLACA